MRKYLILATLILVILTLIVPASTLAAPDRPIIVEMHVVAVSHSALTYNSDSGFLEGTAGYIGWVTDSVRNSKDAWKKLLGANMTASENLYYKLDAYGNVLEGSHAEGIVTISGSNNDTMVITFQSLVFGNIAPGGGGASDIGSWQVIKATGALHTLKDAQGSWIAVVDWTTFEGQMTLAGGANATGTY